MRSMTTDESWEDWVWTLAFNHSILIWETEAGDLCVSKDSLVYMDSLVEFQEYIGTLSQKKMERGS